MYDVNKIRNNSDIYRIKVIKGEFVANMSLKLMDDCVGGDVEIEYREKTLIIDSIAAESFPDAIGNVLERLDRFNALERMVKADGVIEKNNEQNQ